MKKLLLIISVFFSLSYSAQVSLSQSLTACYALDGNANEPINALTGTVSAITPTVNRFGAANSAMHFNGAPTSFIRLPNNALIKPNAVSFSCWAKTDLSNTLQYVVFTTNGCGSYYEGYALAYVNTGPSAYRFQVVKSSSACSSGGQVAMNGATITYSPNTWYHLGFYAGPDSLKLYVNGVLDGSVANANALAYNSNTNVYLGGTNQSPNFPLTGSIDNVRIYNRKLSGTEFNQLFTLDPICQPAPVASFSVIPLNACINQTVSLFSSSTNTPTSYNWTMAGGSPSLATVANPNLTYTTPGVYTISLVASNSFGSSAPATQTINVSTCIGIANNLLNENFSIYPNPNNGEFFVNGLERGTKVEVFNCLGTMVYSATTENDKEKISLIQQRSGIYFVKFSISGKSFTTKLIKE